MLGQSHSFSKVIGLFSAGKIMLTSGYFSRLPAIIYIPVNYTSSFLDCGKATLVGRVMSDFRKIVVVGECLFFSVIKLGCYCFGGGVFYN